MTPPSEVHIISNIISNIISTPEPSHQDTSAGAFLSRPYVRRHLRFGWWSLLVFLALGTVLETMHGFKIGWYLDVDNETRRLMWTLAHTHGTLTSVLHLVFAGTIGLLPPAVDGKRRWASSCLTAASFLLPGGFFLGGLVIYGGDPGLGVLLVPVGALLLFIAVLLTAWQVSERGSL